LPHGQHRTHPTQHLQIYPAARDFLDAGEIDEFDIRVIPTLIGEGIPLMAPRHGDVPLRLRSVRTYPGVVRLRYEFGR
jgi:hypothetical protein